MSGGGSGGRRAVGTLTVGDGTIELTDAWAVLDHGRGRWHHKVRCGADVDLTVTPEYDHVSRTNVGIIGTRGDQVFGTFTAWIRVEGERIEVRELFGWAEDVANTW